MHQPLVEQPTWAHDQEHRNETAKDDHAIAGKPARRLQEADVDDAAKQGPKRWAEAADQAVCQAMHPKHHVEDGGLDIGREMRIEPPAEAGDSAGKAGRHQLYTDDRDALRGGEQIVLSDHAKGDAKPRALEKKKSKQRRAEQ